MALLKRHFGDRLYTDEDLFVSEVLEKETMIEAGRDFGEFEGTDMETYTIK
jgi:hypothetical protein